MATCKGYWKLLVNEFKRQDEKPCQPNAQTRFTAQFSMDVCGPFSMGKDRKAIFMNTGSQNSFDPYLGEVMITDVLRVEHRMLRVMMEATAEWLSKAPATASSEMRARISLLAVALETHALREEQHLFAHLRPRSDPALHLVDMMEIVHDEVRSLFEEIDTMANPKEHIWTILDITETHFVREDEEVFPLAEELLPSKLLLELAQHG